MKNLCAIHCAAVAAFALAVASGTMARPALAQSAAQADNSAQNKSQGQTAQNQSSAKSDRMLTAKVRRALMADKDLSVDAQNVKVITRNGRVTLKGPVASEAEKQKVEADAAAVATQDSVVDRLTVKQ